MSEPDRPLYVLRYTLSAADVPAYERLSRELTGREKAFLFAVLFCAGGAAGVAPESGPALSRWAIAGAVALLLADSLLLAWGGLRRKRALHMARRERDVRVEDEGDRLAIHSSSGLRFVALELIAQVLATDAHVFIRCHGGPIIRPLRIFEDASDMHAYAKVLEQRNIEAAA